MWYTHSEKYAPFLAVWLLGLKHTMKGILFVYFVVIYLLIF